MSNYECKYCEEDLYGDWITIAEGEFCNRDHALHWKNNQRISDLERRNGELEKIRFVASRMANSLYNWKQQDWAKAHAEKMDALVMEHDTLTRTKEQK